MSLTPVTRSQASFKEKRSEFIGILIPVNNGEEVSGILKSLRKKYYTAAHICWAYRLHLGATLMENSSDAGEPSGTAGIPILNVLRRKNIVNGAIFVVRIFGGVKLGRKGLAEAYRKGARLAVNYAQLVKWNPVKVVHLGCPLEFYGYISQLLVQCGGKILVDHSSESLSWDVELSVNQIDKFCERANSFTQGTTTLEIVS